jgi:hypothetical protein
MGALGPPVFQDPAHTRNAEASDERHSAVRELREVVPLSSRPADWIAVNTVRVASGRGARPCLTPLGRFIGLAGFLLDKGHRVSSSVYTVHPVSTIRRTAL